MGIVSPFKLPTRSISMAAPEKPPEMISAGLTNTWMAQAWIKAERSTAAIVITRRIFLSFCRSFICSSIVFKLLVFPILSRPPATLFVFLIDTRRAALPPQKAALSHDQKPSHYKILLASPYQTKTCKALLCAAYECYYSIVSQFCQSFCAF